MYLIGRIYGTDAIVIKFSKNNFSIDWKIITTVEMSEILSVVQPNDSNYLWFAGYVYRSDENPSDRIASVMKMDENGDILLVKQWGESIGDSSTPVSSIPVDDIARAISFDEERSEIVILMEVHTENLRPDFAEYSSCCSN